MRVTDKMTFQTGSVNMQRAQARHARAAEEVSSGKRVIHAWDDPAAAQDIILGKDNLERLKRLEGVTGRAQDELALVDGALDSIGNTLSRARELAVQLANSTYNAAQRASAANEVAQLVGFVVGQLNVESGGRYLLAGRADGAPPFDAAGAYVGDAGVREVEVAPGQWIQSSVRADVALKGTAGGVDVFAVMQSLQTALATNNVAGIQATLGDLDTSIQQVTAARVEGGQIQNLLATAGATARVAATQVEINTGNLANVDLADAASRLALAQRAVEASMAAAQKTFELTLLSRLR